MMNKPVSPLREQWRKLRPRLIELAEDLEQFAFVSRKNFLRLDLEKSRQAAALAAEVRSLAHKTLTEPHEGVANFRPLFSQYLELKGRAEKVVGDWKPLR